MAGQRREGRATDHGATGREGRATDHGQGNGPRAGWDYDEQVECNGVFSDREKGGRGQWSGRPNRGQNSVVRKSAGKF